MLCPECKVPAAGGTACPQCGNLVPERETFSGQGGYYLRILLAVALLLLLMFLIAAISGPGLKIAMRRLYYTGWLWLFLGLVLTPIGVGFYYWRMLHDEEITVTDEYIARRSNWGDDYLPWSEVRAFRSMPTLFKQTRLRRVAWLSRYFAQERLIWHLPPLAYELVGPLDANGEPTILRLEPGTIDELPWLLQLIAEHLGPPQED